MTWNKRTSTPQKHPFGIFRIDVSPKAQSQSLTCPKASCHSKSRLSDPHCLHILIIPKTHPISFPHWCHMMLQCLHGLFQNGSDETGDLWPHLLGNPGVRWHKCFGPKAALSVLMEDFLNHFEVCLDSRAGPSFSGAGCNIFKLWKKCQVLATRLTYWNETNVEINM